MYTETELRNALSELLDNFDISISTDFLIEDWRDAGVIDHIECA